MEEGKGDRRKGEMKRGRERRKSKTGKQTGRRYFVIASKCGQ